MTVRRDTIVKRLLEAGFVCFTRSQYLPNSPRGYVISISCESAQPGGDYYVPAYPAGAHIDPRVKEIADKANCFVDWDNPSSLSVWRR